MKACVPFMHLFFVTGVDRRHGQLYLLHTVAIYVPCVLGLKVLYNCNKRQCNYCGDITVE